MNKKLVVTTMAIGGYLLANSIARVYIQNKQIKDLQEHLDQDHFSLREHKRYLLHCFDLMDEEQLAEMSAWSEQQKSFLSIVDRNGLL